MNHVSDVTLVAILGLLGNNFTQGTFGNARIK